MPSSVSPDAVTIVVADLSRERWIIRGPQHDSGIVGQHQIPAIVVFVHDGAHPMSGHLGGCINMRDEADDRRVLMSRRGRHRGHHVSIPIHRRIGDTE